jgi:hypothetical protein
MEPTPLENTKIERKILCAKPPCHQPPAEPARLILQKEHCFA